MPKITAYITRSKIFAKKEGSREELSEYDWDEKSLSKVFGQIKKGLGGDRFKIILGNDISYTFTIITEKEKLNREDILAEAKTIIMEDFGNESFDWRVVMSSNDGRNNLVQVCGLSKNNLRLISIAAKKNRVRVDVMLPVSIFLAHQSMAIKKPCLLLWSDQENIAAIVDRGAVYHSQNLGEDFDNEVKKVVEFGQDKFGFEINDLVIDVNKWQGIDEIFPDWQLNHYQLNPFNEIGYYGREKGKDEEVLDIKTKKDVDVNKAEEVKEVESDVALPELTTEPVVKEVSEVKVEEVTAEPKAVVDSEPEEKKVNGFKVWYFVVGGMVALILGFGLFFISGNKNESGVENSGGIFGKKPEPTPAVTATPEPTPTPVNFADYKIEILNGSGIEGHATEVEELMLDLEFTEIEKANASNYNYEETEINFKPSVPEEIKTEIEKVISEGHEATSSSGLEENNDYDIVIILGSSRIENK